MISHPVATELRNCESGLREKCVWRGHEMKEERNWENTQFGIIMRKPWKEGDGEGAQETEMITTIKTTELLGLVALV